MLPGHSFTDDNWLNFWLKNGMYAVIYVRLFVRNIFTTSLLRGFCFKQSKLAKSYQGHMQGNQLKKNFLAAIYLKIILNLTWNQSVIAF